MAASTLTIRIDKDLKERASEVLEHYGLDLSTATRAFFTQIVNTNAVPLSFDYEEPNEESMQAIRETEAIFASGARRFKSADELFAALEA